MKLENIRTWILNNKLPAAIILILTLTVIGTAGFVITAFTGVGMSSYNTAETADFQSGLAADTKIAAERDAGTGPYVEVQEADVNINSESIEKDIEKVRETAGRFNGYIERTNRREGELYNSADLTVRVPKANYTEFMNAIKQDFNVESYSITNYRLSTQRENTKLDILQETMKQYQKIRKKIKSMEVSKKKLDLLLKVTENELEIKEKMNRYENRLSDKQKKGNYATVQISLEAERKVDIVPDNIGNRFKNEVKEMLDSVVDISISTVTGGVEIFFKAIQLLIYAAIIALPLGAAYKIGKKVYRRFN
ncbi:MAG: DUF4349 domain-containing protein [Candidatus Nanohaloarchaea archaeon]